MTVSKSMLFTDDKLVKKWGIFNKVLLFLWIILFFISQKLFGLGLTANLGEIVLTDLKIGTTTAVQPLIITNTGPAPTDIRIEVVKPAPEQLKPGYEPIPDTNWIKLDKNYFTNVQPNSSVQTNVTVSIPNSESYLGKKYQVYLWSHTAGTGTIGVGINSRLLLNISENIEKTEQPELPEKILVFVEQLKNKSKFKEPWDIEKEITTDLKESLSQDFTIVDTIDEKLKDKTFIIKSEITKFKFGTNKIINVLLFPFYKYYFTDIEMKLTLILPDGKKEEKQEIAESFSFIVRGTEEAFFNDLITNPKTQKTIKWNSEEFKKSFLGEVYNETIKDLVSWVISRLKK